MIPAKFDYTRPSSLDEAVSALSSGGYPVWSSTVWLPKNTAIQYKYIKKNPDGTVTWEGSSNRTANTGTNSTLTLNDSWR